ncbi:MAG TPA: hypothetical protein VHX37_03640 [Acidobacteriaceae bacterium]|jgi:hypothetical protein|nr:hypothetical protein [Acidobacteriaceae bacterium]
MRFRAKFARVDWAWLAVAAFVSVLFLSGPRHAASNLRYYALMMVLFAATRVLLHFLIFWEIASAGLYERRLWTTRTIPWQEITAIAPWPENRPNRDYVAIEFVRSAPLSARGSVIASPEHREAFLTELRRRAPQATLELPPSASPIPAR